MRIAAHRKWGIGLLALALLAGAAALLLVLGPGPQAAKASSHREAPLIANDPTVDNRDLYAFVSPDRVASSDEIALAELYDRFGRVAYGLALRILRDEALAQDAVQDAFLAIWRSADRFFAERAKASTWILTLVHRRAVDLVRREDRRRAIRSRACRSRPRRRPSRTRPPSASSAASCRRH